MDRMGWTGARVNGRTEESLLTEAEEEATCIYRKLVPSHGQQGNTGWILVVTLLCFGLLKS